MKSTKEKFNQLKKLAIKDFDVSLVIVREYKKARVSKYNLGYVPIDDKLEKRLKTIITQKIESSNTYEAYTFDCIEPEGGQVRSIHSEETDFHLIYQQLISLNPEEDKVENVEELVKAKAYLVILSNDDGIQIIGFKTVPENWKMKRTKNLIPLLFKDNRFEDLETDNVFSISSMIDILYFDSELFILSKKGFETGLNFREGMIAKANELYTEIRGTNMFINIDLLTSKVSNNQRYLRKIATIKNLGYYSDTIYLSKVKEVCEAKNWNIQFEGEQIVFTEETMDDILSILQNKRLHSLITDETFDVDSAKKLSI